MSIQRSILNPLLPIGLQTPETESLPSYFFRLALSHCVSAPELKQKVAAELKWQTPGKYRWSDLNLSSSGGAAEQWSRGLSELTCVSGLHVLTLLPWRNVIAQNNLSTVSSRWCPACFAQDRADRRTPYLRLAWDIGEVDVCPKHKTRLINICPHCGRTNTRNSTSFVVPGWCCSCGAFLGNPTGGVPVGAVEIWKACQIGEMLAAQSALPSAPTREAMIEGLFNLVSRLDDGKIAVFARRIGLNKSTVHYWFNQGGTPAMRAHLCIVSQTGILLPALLTGEITKAQPISTRSPTREEFSQLRRNRASPTTRDCDRINEQLEAFIVSGDSISVSEAARRLNIHPRQLYNIANEKARILGQKWKNQQRSRGQRSRDRAAAFIEVALLDILAEGKGANLRELRNRIPRNVLGSVRDIFTLLEEVKMKVGIR
ncbi:TniQ family protein [Paraburkholderia nemoris]|uniref:TniQ domain-containing protein n=1 Tax=Paraburkholderia nemoris TaxID=2793076 RepID=A0ABM8SY19_9BURK|nr:MULTISPECIES: TniQ family protein [Paraburkholderia]MBK3815256.1 TniQ family protein [Paraburkholderia aspalathi]CAE6714809.1 hypothetical protein R75777_01297 [Paraburkholderia nemoris]CAE6840512.1 hypothetical protein R69776_07023 [Paraburkholderia nemoris]